MARKPSVGSAWSFWKTVRTLSPKNIEEEAAQNFKLAIVGDSAASRLRLREALLTPNATIAERAAANEYLDERDAAPDEAKAKDYAFVLYASATEDGNAISARGANAIPLVGTPDEVAAAMIAQRPDLTVAFGRRLPLFRVAAANKIIDDTARVNGKFALLSALPGVFPPAAIFFPVSALADTIILTKNQVLMIMRLAALHGHKPGYTKQVKELLGTIAGALGWRTLARELVGLVPGGVGVVLKGAIAFSGTFATGRTALWFYQTGRTLSPREIRAIYAGKLKDAREEVKAMREEEAAAGAAETREGTGAK